MSFIEVYVDGACRGNPGKGGWGVYIMNIDPLLMERYYSMWIARYLEVSQHSGYIKMQGAAKMTTNNQMELQAAIEACRFCREFNLKNIKIYTDSVYVHKGITNWIISWHKNNRLDYDSKNPVKNIEYWIELEKMNSSCFQWYWVKGHSTNEGNNIADQLATSAIL